MCGDVDNCPVVPNPDQADADGDGMGAACDTLRITTDDWKQLDAFLDTALTLAADDDVAVELVFAVAAIPILCPDAR